jgi:RND superfamily putative drug exporter
MLPASMKLLGDWNWYLPRWLVWLPGADRRPQTADAVRNGLPAAAAE